MANSDRGRPVGNNNMLHGQNVPTNPYRQTAARTPQTPVSAVYGSGVSPPTMYQGNASDPSNVFPSAPYQQAADLFMNQQVRNRFTTPPPNRSSTITVASSQFSQFQTIYNMETQPMESCMSRGSLSSCYLTTNRFNGKQVVLRRIVGATVDANDTNAITNVLKHFRHPNLVPLHGITVTQEFVLGSPDVIIEYRYIKGAKGMREAFFNIGGNGGQPTDVTEGLAWSLACQLVGLVRMMHETDTPLRGLHISKLLYSDVNGRIYFAGLGFKEIAELANPPPGPRPTNDELRRRDIQDLGLILLQLATKNINARPEDLAQMLRTQRFSQSFGNLITACLEGKHKIVEICRALGERLTMEVGHQQGYADMFFSDCSKELHNGRLMRLMVKLNFVIGSTGALMDYTDTEDKYALRIFYSYLFNQVDENNRARIDWGHVYATLNKLDSGSDDMMQLISNDEHQALLVISFKDMQNILNRTFDGLLADATSTAASLLTQPTNTTASVASPQTLMTPVTPML